MSRSSNLARVSRLALIAGLVCASPAMLRAQGATAQKPAPAATVAPSQAPAAQVVTATCNDGSAYAGASRKGACSSHKGVKSWGSVSGMVTATCNDGTKFTGKSRQGACARHKGVKSWS